MSLVQKAMEKYSYSPREPSLSEVKSLAGPDWPEISQDPEKLSALTNLAMIVEMRAKGIVPDHYTAETECKHCGPVPIFEGCPPQVINCPWCLNRIKGLPIPNNNKNKGKKK